MKNHYTNSLWFDIKGLRYLISRIFGLFNKYRTIHSKDLKNMEAVFDLSDILLVYVTRLNLNFTISPRWQGLDNEWLNLRMNLMHRFLIPSLKIQHDQDFVWLVLVHPDTPDSVLQQITVIPQSRIIKTNLDISERKLISKLSIEYLLKNFESKRLITARIDSDDGIHPEYGGILKKFAALHKNLEEGILTDFPYGCFFNLRTNKGYLRRSPSRSCGISRMETFNVEAETVFYEQHTRISKQRNCISINTDEPMWIQTTHESHINRPRKKLPHIRRHKGNVSDTQIIMEVYPYLADINTELIKNWE